ncbi:MAG: glycosyltransferase family 4 protein [Rickettsia endosymbiont of Platyusa sonomae]|nr:glycosyltransferase family 4 protein [Rickettsia endosymbiont of Platyusa sonomae]
MRVVNVMLNKGLGGVEQAAIDYVSMLLEHQCEVMCIFANKAESEANILPYIKDIEFHKISRIGSRDPIAILKIRKLIQNFKADIIIAHSNHAGFIAGWAAKKLVPSIGVSHGYSIKGIKYTDSIICITEHMKNELQKKILKPIFVLPNITYIANNLTIDFQYSMNKIPVIGILGRLHLDKGINTLLQAVRILKSQGIMVQLFIGGDGEEKENLQKLAYQLSIEKQIKWLGWINDKTKFFSEIDIFCLPSIKESFGIVLLEAMANLKPIVSTDSCGAREILSHENDSVIVPINDAEKLAESIIFLINNPEIVKKYIEGAYKKVQKLYTPAIVGKKLYKILTDITTFPVS